MAVVVDTTTVVDEDADDELVLGARVVSGPGDARSPPSLEQEERTATATSATVGLQSLLHCRTPAIGQALTASA